MPFCYEDSFRVFQFECDPWDRMTPGAALRRIQEISTIQCESVGIDESTYKSTNTVFLLSKLSFLVVGRMPAIEETVRIETRAYGMRRAVYHRVTSLYAQSGEKLCEADSRWVLVDTLNRRILRKPLEQFVPWFHEEPGAEEHDMSQPKPEGELFDIERGRAAYTLCDRNGHINNTRYVDLMFDHLPMEWLAQGPPKRMVLNYHSEIPLNTSFLLRSAPAGERAFYMQTAQENKKCFEGSVEF